MTERELRIILQRKLNDVGSQCEVRVKYVRLLLGFDILDYIYISRNP